MILWNWFSHLCWKEEKSCKCCLNQLAWDDPVDEEIQQKWIKWELSLRKLQEIKLDGCCKPQGFIKVVSCSLHYFSDASESGYGQATYLRLVCTAGKAAW